VEIGISFLKFCFQQKQPWFYYGRPFYRSFLASSLWPAHYKAVWQNWGRLLKSQQQIFFVLQLKGWTSSLSPAHFATHLARWLALLFHKNVVSLWADEPGSWNSNSPTSPSRRRYKPGKNKTITLCWLEREDLRDLYLFSNRLFSFCFDALLPAAIYLFDNL
jgi:hypothetical protein